ncbi:hypothetical protein JCM8208_001971 [Rhodotorula glutinis]
MNGTASSSTAELRQHYNAATRAFLVRDYPSTASSLHDGLALVHDVPQRAWFDAVQGGSPVPLEVTLKRRLDVLQVTFLATVRASPGALAPSTALQPLLDLPPADLVKSLWSNLVAPPVPANAPATALAVPSPDDMLPTPTAAYLHPSLAVALVLAALKLDEPRLARQVAEAWLGSVDDEVEALVDETAREEEWDEQGEWALDAVGAGAGAGVGAGSASMSGSGLLAGGGAGAARQDPRRQLVGAWLKLVDLLVLHVLPQLGEWDAAGDFVRMLGVENGGWVPDARVEAALVRLTDIQRDQVQLAAARAQRQKDLDAARAAAASSSSSSKRRSTSGSGSDKGKSRAAREGSPTHSGDSGSSASSPNGKKSRRRAGDEAAGGGRASASSPGASGVAGGGESQGFAGLRDSLSSYLAPRDAPAAQRPPPSSSSSSVVKRGGPLRALGRYLAEHYAADPVRLLSAVLFAFAFVTWARRRVVHRRARGESGLGVGDVLRLMGARVGDTFGMMTRITAM